MKKILMFFWAVLLSGNALAINFCATDSVSLQNSLDSAASQATEDQSDVIIGLVQGTYAGPFSVSSQAGSIIIQGGYDAECSTLIRNPALTVLDGNSLSRVLTIDTESRIEIRNLTLQNGWVDEESFFQSTGGALKVTTRSVNAAVMFDATLIQKNSAEFSGGAGRLTLFGGSITFVNSVFYANVACPGCPLQNTLGGTINGAGGALSIFAPEGEVNFSNNTFVANEAPAAGAIQAQLSSGDGASEGTMMLVNNLFWDNSVPEGGEAKDIAIFFSHEDPPTQSELPEILHNNLDTSLWGVRFGFAYTFDPSNIMQDPLLVDPVTGNFQVGAGSLMVDAGGASAEVTSFDFAGNERNQGASVDIGALESSPSQTPRFSVEVEVTGLDSSVALFEDPVTGYRGEALEVANGDDSPIFILENGAYLLGRTFAEGETYDIKVLNQPFLGTQTCTVQGGTGEVVDSPVTVSVTCSQTSDYLVGGKVSGLEVGETIVLVSYSGQEQTISADGAYSFGPYFDGSAYAIHVDSHPSGKFCEVQGWTGILAGADVENIDIVCTQRPEIGPQYCVSTDADLQNSLSLAALSPDPVEIRLEVGNYGGGFRYFSTDTSTLALVGDYDAGCSEQLNTPAGSIMDGANTIRILDVRSGSDVLIKNLTIRNGLHRQHGGFAGIGGGIRATVWQSGSLSMEGNVFDNNVGNTDGGAAYLSVSDGEMRLENNVFSNNVACPRCPATLQIGDSTSSFGGSGGAIWLNAFSGGQVNLVNNTFFSNRASFGGGVRISMNSEKDNESFSRLVNNIFYNNSTIGNEGSDVWMQYDQGAEFVPQFPPVVFNNSFSTNTTVDVFADFDFAFNLTGDPEFSDPEQGDLSLQPTSPLVDAGADDLASAQRSSRANFSLPATDILGNPRVSGQAVDLGAFELRLDQLFSDSFESLSQ